MPSSKVIGITTTVPIEIPYAAGYQVVDLNNIFVASPLANQLIDTAEGSGFPTTCCAWTKGLYGLLAKHDIKELIGVVEGDCSDSAAMLDILRAENFTVHPFAYPFGRKKEALAKEIQELTTALGTTPEAIEDAKNSFDTIRHIAREIDTIAWQHNTVSSQELFTALLSLSDMLGDPSVCTARLASTLSDIQGREEQRPALRLGCVGVPTILEDLWEVIDAFGARIVYHEVPLEFSGVRQIGKPTLDAYLDFSYPYDAAHRIEIIAQESEARQLDGIIHYVQTFCHRQIHDRLLRERVDVPVLTIEADRPGKVDGRTETRIEAFLEHIGE